MPQTDLLAIDRQEADKLVQGYTRLWSNVRENLSEKVGRRTDEDPARGLHDLANMREYLDAVGIRPIVADTRLKQG